MTMNITWQDFIPDKDDMINMYISPETNKHALQAIQHYIKYVKRGFVVRLLHHQNLID
jgi:hypothetical protein